MNQEKNLQGVFHGVHDIRVDESSRPKNTDDGVIIKVSKAGICGSDIHFYHSEIVPPGSVLGHEFTGVINEVGQNVKGLSPGMRVVVNPMVNGIGLGLKPGGFANYIHVENAARNVNVIPIPENISKEQGALIEPLTVGYAGVNLVAVKKETNAIVFGAGTIGLATIASLASKGVKTIIASDVSDKRLEKARELGATITFNPSSAKMGLQDFLIEKLGSTPSLFGMELPNLDAAFECSGVPSVFIDALNGLRIKGKLIILATYPQKIEIDISHLVLQKALTVQGSFAYTSEEMIQVIDLVSSGKVDLTSIVTHEYALKELPQAFETQADSQKSIKVLVAIS
ncbi:zinc-dependent alcohol dehydrogenase [Flagellimonas aequoris]|uniref:Zinc-binding dehydrogenase n=1 Tax=Flagellimonas aequoris TaxID=2306997 RepID=A0A418N6F2_9FLAO|nr:zinc-binding dehydrogenase [Allomuricauda aequoris]RIV70155.1 hypothetical protein D2U88_11125 [Allomuricauda aequoris]TXK01752.1 zinc-binding dehydrogenase [Allomuricauda aequoris]|tara:strand:+ start:255 stop:1277 length:1023 start_codon:yes stop_codon:yes gene_type:complete